MQTKGAASPSESLGAPGPWPNGMIARRHPRYGMEESDGAFSESGLSDDGLALSGSTQAK